MRKDTILALVPAYDPRPADLAASIQSLLDQTVDVDICVIDDGSAQPVAPLLPKNERITAVREEKNRGITKALRRGVEFGLERNYEYLCRLDVGDIAHSKRLALQLEFMRTHPDVDIVGGYSRVISPNGRTLFMHGVSGGSAVVQRYLWKNSPFKHSTFFMRASAVSKWGNYDESFCTAEDYELLLRFARFGKIDCLAEVVIDYVDDPGGISTKKRGSQLRQRLRAQLMHASPATPGWYVGIGRSLGTMAFPDALMKRISAAAWARRGRGQQFPC